MPKKEHTVRTYVTSLYGRTNLVAITETFKTCRVLAENAYVEYNKDDDCIDLFELRPETAVEKKARLEKAAKQRLAAQKRRETATNQVKTRELELLAKLTKKYGPLANSGQPAVATAKQARSVKRPA